MDECKPLAGGGVGADDVARVGSSPESLDSVDEVGKEEDAVATDDSDDDDSEDDAAWEARQRLLKPPPTFGGRASQTPKSSPEYPLNTPGHP